MSHHIERFNTSYMAPDGRMLPAVVNYAWSGGALEILLVRGADGEALRLPAYELRRIEQEIAETEG